MNPINVQELLISDKVIFISAFGDRHEDEVSDPMVLAFGRGSYHTPSEPPHALAGGGEEEEEDTADPITSCV